MKRSNAAQLKAYQELLAVARWTIQMLAQETITYGENSVNPHGYDEFRNWSTAVRASVAKASIVQESPQRSCKNSAQSTDNDYAINGGSGDSTCLTKREHIAALALQGLLANPSHNFRDAASNAVVVADELIAALNYYPVEEPDHEEFSVPIPGDPDYYEG